MARIKREDGSEYCPKFIRYLNARGKETYVALCDREIKHEGRCRAPSGTMRFARDKEAGPPYGTMDWPSVTPSDVVYYNNWYWDLGLYRDWWRWLDTWYITTTAREVFTGPMPEWEVGMRVAIEGRHQMGKQ